MTDTPRLALSYISPQQAQKHVTMNETIRRLDAIVQATVETRALTDPPASPANGAAYIPAAGAVSAWAGADDQLAVFQDGAWTLIEPSPGWRVWLVDEAVLLVWSGSAWSTVSASSTEVPLLGINATADTTNRLSVNSPSVLFNRETDDINLTLNKNAAVDDARVSFQSGFSSRAIVGLLAGDDLTIKVSNDGASFINALSIDKDNGFVGLNVTNPAQRLHVDGGVVTENNQGYYSTDLGGSAHRIIHVGADNNVYYNGVGTGELRFRTNGATHFRLTADGGVVVGSPAGSSQGSGSINAQSVYDDNALLSCYVFDQALDGQIDAQKWDAKVPDRGGDEHKQVTSSVARVPVAHSGEASNRETAGERRAHEPMRRFQDRIGTDFDPLTLDGYARHWREKRHLTAMPNEARFDSQSALSVGDWAQRLLETVEIQAVLIEQLNVRLKAVEAKEVISIDHGK